MRCFVITFLVVLANKRWDKTRCTQTTNIQFRPKNKVWSILFRMGMLKRNIIHKTLLEDSNWDNHNLTMISCTHKILCIRRIMQRCLMLRYSRRNNTEVFRRNNKEITKILLKLTILIHISFKNQISSLIVAINRILGSLLRVRIAINSPKIFSILWENYTEQIHKINNNFLQDIPLIPQIARPNSCIHSHKIRATYVCTFYNYFNIRRNQWYLIYLIWNN